MRREIHCEGCEDLWGEPPDVPRIVPGNDSDDLVGASIETDRATQHTGIASEFPLPIAVSQHDHIVAPGRDVIFRQKRPADMGTDSLKSEVVPGDQLAHDAFDPISLIHLGECVPRAHGPLEDVLRGIPDVIEIGKGDGAG